MTDASPPTASELLARKERARQAYLRAYEKIQAFYGDVLKETVAMSALLLRAEETMDYGEYKYECGCILIEDRDKSTEEWFVFVTECPEHGEKIKDGVSHALQPRYVLRSQQWSVSHAPSSSHLTCAISANTAGGLNSSDEQNEAKAAMQRKIVEDMRDLTARLSRLASDEESP